MALSSALNAPNFAGVVIANKWPVHPEEVIPTEKRENTSGEAITSGEGSGDVLLR